MQYSPSHRSNQLADERETAAIAKVRSMALATTAPWRRRFIFNLCKKEEGQRDQQVQVWLLNEDGSRFLLEQFYPQEIVDDSELVPSILGKADSLWNNPNITPDKPAVDHPLDAGLPAPVDSRKYLESQPMMEVISPTTEVISWQGDINFLIPANTPHMVPGPIAYLLKQRLEAQAEVNARIAYLSKFPNLGDYHNVMVEVQDRAQEKQAMSIQAERVRDRR